MSFATPAIVLGSSAAAGSAGTAIRSDSTIAAFDATAPTTQAFGDAAAVGTAAFAARRDHKHAMPATPVTGFSKNGSTVLTGAVTLTGGTGVTLTQSSQDISIAASGSGGGLLASAYYNPSGGTVTKTASATLTAMDTTNLRATFTAPASGNVIVKGFVGRLNPNNCNPHLGVLDGSTTIGTCIQAAANASLKPAECVFKVTGLTPGNTYSYDLAIATTNQTTAATFQYGFTTSNLADGTGPAIIEVWSA